MIGEYAMPGSMDRDKKVRIEKKRIMSSDGISGVISDSLIIRRVDDYLVVNKLENSNNRPEIKGSWSVYLLKKNLSGNLEVTSFSASQDEKEKYFNYLAKNFRHTPVIPIISSDYEESMVIGDTIQNKVEDSDSKIESPELEPKDYPSILLELSQKDFSKLIGSDFLISPIILKNVKNN
jgi:hypothetical protein